MIPEDSDKFKKMLDAVMEVYDRQVSSNARKIWWKTLRPYSLDQVAQALWAHAESSKFAPRPADVIEFLRNADGRPSADEAWAIALQSADEHATVVTNDEIAEALGAAAPILAEGDRVAARMAFKSAYERVTEQSRDAGIAVNWWPSLGRDPRGREAALRTAESKGQLTQQRVTALLPTADEPIAENVAALLTDQGAPDEGGEVDHALHIARVREVLAG